MNSTWDPTSRIIRLLENTILTPYQTWTWTLKTSSGNILNKQIVQCTPVKSSKTIQLESNEPKTIPETPAAEFTMSTQQIEQLRIEQDIQNLTSDWTNETIITQSQAPSNRNNFFSATKH